MLGFHLQQQYRGGRNCEFPRGQVLHSEPLSFHPCRLQACGVQHKESMCTVYMHLRLISKDIASVVSNKEHTFQLTCVMHMLCQVFVQHSERSFHKADKATKNNVWEMFSEVIPRYKQTNIRNKEPLEQYNQTKDQSDYLWYTTRCCFLISSHLHFSSVL